MNPLVPVPAVAAVLALLLPAPAEARNADGRPSEQACSAARALLALKLHAEPDPRQTKIEADAPSSPVLSSDEMWSDGWFGERPPIALVKLAKREHARGLSKCQLGGIALRDTGSVSVGISVPVLDASGRRAVFLYRRTLSIFPGSHLDIVYAVRDGSGWREVGRRPVSVS